MVDYLVQNDGTSKFLLNSGGAIILNSGAGGGTSESTFACKMAMTGVGA